VKPNDDIIEVLPVSGCEPHVPAVLKTATGKEIKYIRKDEARRMLAVLQGRDRLIVQMLWHTGLRTAELLSIRVSDIDFEQNTITVRTLKKKMTLPRKAKVIKAEIRVLELALKENTQDETSRDRLAAIRACLAAFERQPPALRFRTIPVYSPLTEQIASYAKAKGLDKDYPLFTVSRMTVYRIVRKAGAKAGLDSDRANPQAFRHGFAINAVLAGVPPLLLQQWLGHVSVRTTLVYTEALRRDTKDYLLRMAF